jgi:ATP-dependent Clp protease adaptor protein ClpS
MQTGPRMTETALEKIISAASSSDEPTVSQSGSNESSENDAVENSGDTSIITESRSRTKTPPLYQVILVNDDYTPMEFVILVLQKFFSKDIAEATKIMLQVHQKGAGLCGVFSHEIAETKVYLVNQYARTNKHPLKCTMEVV